MNVLCNRNLASWLLALAYVALIAHVFIPHHHHGEQTAFLDFKSCPHVQHEHAGNEHQDHADDATQTPFSLPGECETLKYVWIQDQQISLPDADLAITLFLPDLVQAAEPFTPLPHDYKGTKHRHSDSKSYTSYIALSQGLRAPPALA